jgi:hypothetical protein
MRAFPQLPVVCVLAMIALPVAGAQLAESTQFSIADLGETAPIVIDGRLEAAWSAVPATDRFEEYRPRQGVPASVRTEVRFARDARFLYVAARMFDPDIERLRTGLARRDNFSNEQDWISIAIDPLGSRRASQLFYFNPDGVIWDGLTNEDAGTSTPAADFELDIATHVAPDSWIVELRIPFEEVRYASRTPESWHVLVRRNYPREERHAMAAPPIPANAPCFMCLAAPIHPPGLLPAPRSLSVVPQVVTLGRWDRADGNTASESELEPSADVKFRSSAASVFDATVNPDFSQVELDTPQLSSNRQFAVSFPEKRPFFLEGLDILDSPLQAIYTRSITDPDWGLRATHRGAWDGVLLTTADDGGGFVVLPGAFGADYLPQDFASHATVGRLRKPMGAVTVGALATDRRAGDGYNTVAGPDISWRLSPGTRINAQWLTSRTRAGNEYPGVGTEAISGAATSIDLLHESPHWHAEVQLGELDEHFRADNGYIPQVGIRQLATKVRYKIVDLAAVSELAPYVSTDNREDLHGKLVSSAPRAGVQITLPSNLMLTTEWRPREKLRVRADSAPHGYAQGYVALTSYPGARIPVLTLEALVGEAIDFSADRLGRGETIAVSVLWRPINRIEIEPRIDFTTVRTDPMGALTAQSTRESAAQLLATLHLSARNRFRLIVQRVQVERKERGEGALVDERRLIGSLLFTHERSLTRRIYAGVSFARRTAPNLAGPRETAELFLKIQSGMSGSTGVRW